MTTDSARKAYMAKVEKDRAHQTDLVNTLTTQFLSAPGTRELARLLTVRGTHRDNGATIPCDTNPDKWTVSGKYTPGDTGRAHWKATQLCAGCPLQVKRACKAYGDASGDQHMILGGIHPSTRTPVTSNTEDIDHVAVNRIVTGTPPLPKGITRAETLAVLIRMTNQGHTMEEIAKRTGRSNGTLSDLARRHGITPARH